MTISSKELILTNAKFDIYAGPIISTIFISSPKPADGVGFRIDVPLDKKELIQLRDALTNAISKI